MKKAKLSEDYVHSDEEGYSSEVVSKKKFKAVSKEKSKEESNEDSQAVSNNVFELSSKRRVTLRKFKSNVLVDIREFYEDRVTGEELPGKKGISLTLEQFSKLKDLLPRIEAAIEEGNFE